ncbi:hypothetical protein [Synechococcus sp. PCC 7336]|nr:hypothetical protein [Synechococcus sp. PCC 7336]
MCPLDLGILRSLPNAAGFYERMGARQVGQLDNQPRILPVFEIAL